MSRTPVHPFILLMAALTIMLAASSCQPIQMPPPTPDASKEPLVGTLWHLNEFQDGQRVHEEMVSATFSADGTLAGTAGCNAYSTTYEVDGSAIAIDPNFEAGQNVCDEEIMAIESRYLAELQEIETFGIIGRILFLRNGDHIVTLVLDSYPQ